MILTQILEPTSVKVPLEGANKEEAITALVDLLAENKQLDDRDNVLDAVLKREQTRSTGIGSGIAIPHGKCGGVKSLTMAIGISKEGFEFDSVDGKKVYIIVLIASPADRTGPHIQALARISRLMLDEDFKNGLQNSTTAEEAYKMISDKESE